MTTQQVGFQDRVARINSAKQARDAAQPVRRSGSKLENLAYALSFVWATLIGMASVFMVRLVMYHFVGAELANGADLQQLIIGAGFALIVLFAVRQLTTLEGPEHMTAQIAGFWIAFTCFHNLAHWMPDQTSTVFSRAYVAQVQATTNANTIRYRGMEVYFVDPAKGSSAMSAGLGALHDRNTPPNPYAASAGGRLADRLLLGRD